MVIPGGGGVGGNYFPKFQKFGQNPKFSGSDRKTLGKIRNFRGATKNCLS